METLIMNENRQFEFRLEEAFRKKALLVNIVSSDFGWLESKLETLNIETKVVFSFNEAVKALKSTPQRFSFIFVEAGFESEELYFFPMKVRNIAGYELTSLILFSSTKNDIHEHYALRYGYTKVMWPENGLRSLFEELKDHLEDEPRSAVRFPIKLPKEIYLKSGIVVTEINGMAISGFSNNYLAVGTELVVEDELFQNIQSGQQGKIRILACEKNIAGEYRYKVEASFLGFNSKLFNLSRLVGMNSESLFKFNKKVS